MAGWDLHPLENAALSRRTPIADIADRFPIFSVLVEHHIDDALHQGPADHRGDGYEQVESEAQERGRVKGPLRRRLDLGFVCEKIG